MLSGPGTSGWEKNVIKSSGRGGTACSRGGGKRGAALQVTVLHVTIYMGDISTWKFGTLDHKDKMQDIK